MKTILSSGLVGVLSLSFFGCAGADDSPEPSVAAAVADDSREPAEAAPVAAVISERDTSLDEPPAPEANTVDPILPIGPDVRETPVTPTLIAPSELHWRACGQFQNRNLECAELNVPVDYNEPDGEQLPIAMRRILANPLEPHRGALLFNPGGPGGEGIDVALQIVRVGLFDQIAPGFDIIGFDPRGVAASGERGCGIAPPDLYPGAKMGVESDDTSAEEALQGLRELGEACEREWGPVFRKLGSNNVVRDLEEMRKALHERKLNFYGASYGTRLGALYAHTYPETTGRIVLDAPVHPRTSYVELVRGQFYKAIEMNETLFALCDQALVTCPPNARQVFDQVLANARKRGLEDTFKSAWLARLASESGTAGLLQALASEVAEPGGDWIERFLGGGGGGDGIGIAVFASITCTDDAFEPPSIEQLESLYAEFQQASPVFANYAGSAALCMGWPTTRDPVPLLTAIDAPPLLVIGGINDPRTPLAFARAMTETLGNATLLTSTHWGHGALGAGGDCVTQAIRAYLTSGSLPATGTTCSSN